MRLSPQEPSVPPGEDEVDLALSLKAQVDRAKIVRDLAKPLHEWPSPAYAAGVWREHGRYLFGRVVRLELELSALRNMASDTLRRVSELPLRFEMDEHDREVTERWKREIYEALGAGEEPETS